MKMLFSAGIVCTYRNFALTLTNKGGEADRHQHMKIYQMDQ